MYNKKFLYLILLTTYLNASPQDNFNLTQAYKSYQAGDYNNSQSYLKKITTPSLQSKITLANIYYKQRKYKKAIESYKSIQSTSIKIKQQLYYNIANSYAKIYQYDNAKEYYAKVLQLGSDEDAEYNLKIIALLSDKKDNKLGKSFPKSQNSASSKSNSEKSDSKETKRDENEPSSGSSGDGKSNREKEKNRLKNTQKEEKHPLSSKVYELINEGYIYEKEPW